MKLKRICQFLSLGLVIYLFCLFSLQIDIAPTKNRALNTELQMELNAGRNVTVLREKALSYLKANYDSRVRQSKRAQKACLILGGLLVIQGGMLLVEYRQKKN